MPRYSVKPGRGPSSFGVIGGVIGGGFGVVWTIFAIVMVAGSPFPMVIKIVFPLCGVVFIVLSIAGAIYNGYNAMQPNRFSLVDLVPTETEPEPMFRSPKQTAGERGDEKYCTHCCAAMREADKFCSACGGAATG